MKKHFPGYYNYTDSEVKTIWKKGYFVFDTCVLLNIYYLSSQKKAFLDILDKLKKRIQLPYHIAEEYHKNIFHKINEQYQHFSEIKNKVSRLQQCIQDSSRQGLWDSKEEQEKIIGQISSIGDKIDAIQNNNLYAELRSRIADLFSSAVCEQFSLQEIEKIENEAKKRFGTCSAPGYKDKNKTNSNIYGDFIIWQSLQKISKTAKLPIIFVTEDVKGDWFVRINNIQYARPDWLNEFVLNTKQNLLIYTLPQFIDNYSKYIDQNKEDLAELKSEIKDVQAMRQNDSESTNNNQINNVDSTEASDSEK